MTIFNSIRQEKDASLSRAASIGVGWRPEMALDVERYPRLGFVEVVAEDVDPDRPLPPALEQLLRRGVPIIPHAISLSLGSAETPDRDRLRNLDRLARRLGAPLVSEHLSFVRAGGVESGHLLPLPRTRETLAVVVENVKAARDALSVPLALENVSSLFEWPGAEMTEPVFLREVAERADVQILLDVENVYANARNHGFDAKAYLDEVPLERIAYVHIAGGFERGGLYHDTHTRPVPAAVLELLEELCARTAVPGVLLERDDSFPGTSELYAELDDIAAATERGAARREVCHAGR